MARGAGRGRGRDAAPGAGAEEEARERLGLPIDGSVIGVVGRLAPVKDHRTFLEAAARVVADRPDTTVVVAGDGQLRGSLEAEARDMLGDRVRFLGWVQDLPALYGAIDVVALTSRSEGTPVALIEAAASGTPVVATGVGGVPDVVRDRETGLLVPPRDPVAVAAQLVTLLEDPQGARRMGEEGARWVRDRFSQERQADDLTRLYRSCWRARPRPPAGRCFGHASPPDRVSGRCPRPIACSSPAPPGSSAPPVSPARRRRGPGGRPRRSLHRVAREPARRARGRPRPGGPRRRGGGRGRGSRVSRDLPPRGEAVGAVVDGVPGVTTDVNVRGTANVLAAAHEAGAVVVMASSSAVYGDQDVFPVTESMALMPRSPYGASKLALEIYGAAWGRAYGVPAVSLRYFNVYGPGQDPESE